jgi:TolB-like protein
MKRYLLPVLCALCVAAGFSCASSGGSADGAASLDDAIRESAERLGTDLAGEKAAVLAFTSPSQALSEYVIEELSLALANTGKVTVVDRRELELVRAELRFSLTGEVSDESAQRIGHMLGAQAVVSGSLTDVGGAYRFRIKAINTESAAIESGPGFDVGKRDKRLAHLLNGAKVQTAPATQAAAPPQTEQLNGAKVQTAPAAQAAAPPQTGQRILPNDLETVFGVKGASAAFNAVHAFLQTCNTGSAAGRRERIARRIVLGDWIDLPHLTVQEYTEGGYINTDNIDLKDNGKLLRLIVVGIDSFAATNKDAPAHVVFQFQNIPGYYRMNASDGNAGGYKASEMRRYLTGNFLRGLVAAGVPEGVLYAPMRYIANGGQNATAADALPDWLWLPTEREMFGRNIWSNKTYETAANQARLEYYESEYRRMKYDKGGDLMWWWEASPDAAGAGSSCYVSYGGYPNYYSAGVAGGCAPAFCVR